MESSMVTNFPILCMSWGRHGNANSHKSLKGPLSSLKRKVPGTCWSWGRNVVLSRTRHILSRVSSPKDTLFRLSSIPLSHKKAQSWITFPARVVKHVLESTVSFQGLCLKALFFFFSLGYLKETAICFGGNISSPAKTHNQKHVLFLAKRGREDLCFPPPAPFHLFFACGWFPLDVVD